MINYILISIILMMVIVFIIFLFKMKNYSQSSNELKASFESTNKEVNDVLDKISSKMADRLDKITDQMNYRLKENVTAINESKSFLTDRVENTEKTVRSVTENLSKLHEISTKLVQTNNEILNFQKMLKVPKIRGSFGEVMLENLLHEHLPHEHFKMQYKFSASGEIADAIIKLIDNKILAIDSKFPLSNFEKVTLSTEEDKKRLYYKAFIDDVKKHVKDIAYKYISPKENTLDFAFMYIPIEGIYYEIAIKRKESSTDIWEYCAKNRVYPVSPNSLMSYLQTVMIGFKGMQIEKRTKEILSYISQIRKDFERFSDDFSLIGSHITHAKNKYDDSVRKLDKFSNRLGQIEVHDTVLITDEQKKEEIFPVNN